MLGDLAWGIDNLKRPPGRTSYSPRVIRTYSLDEAITQLLGPEPEMKNPRLWVMRQIRSGRFRAIKVGHQWRMTDEQLEAAVKALENKAAPAEPDEPSDSWPAITPRGRALPGMR